LSSNNNDGFEIRKFMEVGADDIPNSGVPFLDRYWAKITQPIGGDGDEDGDEDGENGGNKGEPQNDGDSDFNWLDILKYAGPAGIAAIIIGLIIKSRGSSGPKAKKIKGGAVSENLNQFTDDFFDSEF
jgi:hypothetical protein